MYITRDLDIIVKPELWNELIKKFPLEDKKSIKVGSIEIYKDWLPWFEDESVLIDNADIIEGFRFVKLEHVLKWKKLFNREKDKENISLTEGFLNNNSNI